MGKKEKHLFVEDDIIAEQDMKNQNNNKIIWHITQHRILLKFYDMLDICLLIALIIFTIKIMQWVLW